MSEVRYGPARIAFYGDRVRAQGFLDEALHLLRNTEERARLGGLAVLSDQRRLDDESYCYVVLAGGMAAVHIVAGQLPATEPAFPQPIDIPDFLSGVVHNGYIRTVPAAPNRPEQKLLDTFHPTQSCARRFDLDSASQAIERLAVEPFDAFASELQNPSENSSIVYSQYTRLKPTMYSGRMRRVVQALMGFGKQKVENGAETSIYSTPTTGKSKAALSQYQKDVASKGLQIRYDWRFSRTHGISKAADNTLWLVEIGITQGVVATPLPLNAKTADPAFRLKLEDDQDVEALAMLDEFGGFPTGEGFPAAGAAYEAWIRAGRILRLLPHEDMQPFYDCTSYSSAMGWAFNVKGTEAHNTAWYVETDDIQRGVHYVVALNIGASLPVQVNPRAAVLKEAFEGLRAQYPDIVDAAIWKLDRLELSDLRWAQSLLSHDPASSILFVDGLVLDPIAQGTANLSRAGVGYLHNNAKTGGVIRFPEPALNLLVSHGMHSLYGELGADKRCDTTMHVFFAGDDLKTVKYFRDPRTTPGTTTSDFEACMFQGSWTETTQTGNIGTLPCFYTSDFDDRAEYPEFESSVHVTGGSLGYCAITVNDNPVFPPVGTASRRKRFSISTETRTTTGQAVTSAIAVPFHDREAYYYSTVSTNLGSSYSKGVGYPELGDPWSCTYWRNFPGYTGHFVGDINNGHWERLDQHPDGCGPVIERYGSSPSPIYSGSGCSDNADSGPWCSVCTNIDRLVFFIPPPPPTPFVFESTPAASEWSVWLVNSSEFSPLRTDFGTGEWGDWSLHSPFTGDANVSDDQYIETTCNVLGAADSLRYDLNLNEGIRVIGVPHYAEMDTGGSTYIGVINGG